MTATVLVPGYGGRVRAVERWRMRVALRTLDALGGGRLVVSGHRGEAARLASLAPAETEVVVEPAARTSFENVQRSLALLRSSERIAIASDRFHRARMRTYVEALEPALLERLVAPVCGWRDRGWMDLASGMHELALRGRTLLRR